MKKRIGLGLIASCGLLLSVGASAVVNDDPYFELYPSGDGQSVDLCGYGDCTDTSLDMIVEVYNENGKGSGIDDVFLRIAQNEPPGTPGSETTESGYNTDNDDLQDGTYTGGYINQAKDTTAGNGDDFNHAVLIGDLEVYEKGGTEYYAITLDVNEPGGNKDYIKLDEFEIHLSGDGSLSQYDGTTASSFGDSSYEGLVFDMDLENEWGGLILRSVNEPNGGNGQGDEDYIFYVPVELFNLAGADAGTYMHVVATFGEADYTCLAGEEACDDPIAYAEANFEEFRAKLGEGSTEVPVPATILLVGLGLLGLGRKRMFAR